MKTQESIEQQSLTKTLTRTNWLLTAIAVLLTMGLIMDVLIYSSVITLPNDIHYGFNAIYERMGRMRVY